MKPWNASEDAILRSNYGKVGTTAEAIGLVLNRSKNSVVGRARDLGLCEPHPHLRGMAKRRAVSAETPVSATTS